jgi:hypothetical protein
VGWSLSSPDYSVGLYRRSYLPDIEFIKDLLQQANSKWSRSTALNPLQWALGILVFALVGATKANAPAWLLVTLAACATVLFLAFLVAYFFLLIKDRDALRSEKYSLSKLAIERSITGDSISGFLESRQDRQAIAPPEPTVGDER